MPEKAQRSVDVGAADKKKKGYSGLNSFALFGNTERCVYSCLCMISLEIAKQAGTRVMSNVCSLHIRKRNATDMLV